jgi:hypothetical protein
MKPYYPALIVLITSLMIVSCKNEISPERVRKQSEHSIEITKNYLEQEKTTYELAIKKRIKALDADMKKLQDVSGNNSTGVADNLKHSLSSMQSQKDQLEFQLRELRERTKRTNDMIVQRWENYNHSVDTMLMSMQTFLRRFEGIRDSVEKKSKP